MRILFMLNGLTHYFNLLTSKINEQPGIEIFYVYPKEISAAMGEGVLHTKEGVNFKLVELEEKVDKSNGSLYYKGLSSVLEEMKPDVIMVAETNIRSLMYDEQLKKTIKKQDIKVILKSIPFRLKQYKEEIEYARKEISKLPMPLFNSLPVFVGNFLKLLKIDKLYKKAFLDKKALKQFIEKLDERKKIFNYADAHVNYVEEAYDIYGSYGVPKEKIFVTFNSPDTDTYFAVKEKIKKLPPILAPNPYRIIHLSRLVKWKRVDMLVQAVANIRHTYPGMELLVVGDGPEKESLKEMTRELKVEHAVNFLGGVYDAEMFGRYIMCSSIYVLAGMGGLSINDAMIFGLPVICSVCDGTEKYLVKEGYNGLFFREGNQKDLEDKISYLFDNPQQSAEMGQHSVHIIEEKININTVVDRYVKAFKAVAEQKIA